MGAGNLRLIGRAVVTDIANAVREATGGHDTMKPAELADVLEGFDGTAAGGVELGSREGEGLISAKALRRLASVIRAKARVTRRYRPDVMPAAVRALDAGGVRRLRAFLHENGELELTFALSAFSAKQSPVYEHYAVDAGGYDSAEAVPWHGERGRIQRVAIASGVWAAQVESIAHWFEGCEGLVSVDGYEQVGNSCAEFTRAFSGCRRLDTISGSEMWPAGMGAGVSRTGAEVFTGCVRLVGADGRLIAEGTGADELFFGGAVVETATDGRVFTSMALYEGGTLVVGLVRSTRKPIASGRLCPAVSYGAEAMPWVDFAENVRRVRFRADVGEAGATVLDHWFEGCTGLRTVSGLGHVKGLRSMRGTFAGCTGVRQLNLRGLDGDELTDAEDAFSGCVSLRRIVTDAGFSAPNAAGLRTFAGCGHLEGGNGTAWSAQAIGAEMLRIDETGTEGYLTAYEEG